MSSLLPQTGGLQNLELLNVHCAAESLIVQFVLLARAKRGSSLYDCADWKILISSNWRISFLD